MPSYEEIRKKIRERGMMMQPQMIQQRQPLPVIDVTVTCPHCNEPFPMRIRIAQMGIAIERPVPKEEVVKRP